MGLKHWFNAQSDTMKATIIGGLITITGGIVTGSFTLTNSSLDKPSSADNPTITATIRESQSPATVACQDKLSLTSPVEDKSFTSGSNAVMNISGTACNLGSDTGWLFDYGSEDKYYYADYSGSTPSPVAQGPESSTWRFPDIGIGDPGDQAKRYTITLVLASPSCAKYLLTTQIDGDYKVPTFPAVCAIADKRDVYVTYP